MGTRRSPGRRAAPETLPGNGVLVMHWTPSILPPGSQLRSAACLLCRDPAGAKPVKILTVVSMRSPLPAANLLAATGFLTCAVHWPLTMQELLDAVHREVTGCTGCELCT